MTDLYLIALKGRLLAKTSKLENGCWYCSAGGETSRYGSIWYINCNINNHIASWLIHKGPVPSGMLICHSCDYKRCINPDHLFSGTEKENIQDCVQKGRRDKRHGERNPAALITEETVREIRYFCEHSGLTQQRIADHFGISQVLVGQIKNKKRWAHV